MHNSDDEPVRFLDGPKDYACRKHLENGKFATGFALMPGDLRGKKMMTSAIREDILKPAISETLGRSVDFDRSWIRQVGSSRVKGVSGDKLSKRIMANLTLDPAPKEA